MEDHHHHQHSTHKSDNHHTQEKPHVQSPSRVAFSATVHCLIGCGIGEVLGVIIGTAVSLPMSTTMVVGILLGFVFGFLLGIYPLLKAGFALNWALKQVLVAEGLSIVVMEAFEVVTQLLIPGVMEAGLTDRLFWIGMIAALIVGFVAAYPVNVWLVKRGIRHYH